jgi:hypothetical protein
VGSNQLVGPALHICSVAGEQENNPLQTTRPLPRRIRRASLLQIDQRGHNACFFFLTTLSSSSRAVLCPEQGPSKSNIPSAKRRKQHGLLTTSCVRSRSLLARPELASAHSSSETFFRFAGLALAVATPLLLTPRLAMRLAWYNHGARLVP